MIEELPTLIVVQDECRFGIDFCVCRVSQHGQEPGSQIFSSSGVVCGMLTKMSWCYQPRDGWKRPVANIVSKGLDKGIVRQPRQTFVVQSIARPGLLRFLKAVKPSEPVIVEAMRTRGGSSC